MNLQVFLKDTAWDIPFFKILPSNDTGESSGHQGGIVVPKDLRAFFPILTGDTTSISPTIDHHIRVNLYNGCDKIASASTRYQFQTWGGTRSPESRLTSGLGPIRNLAIAGDIMLFQRNIENLNFYRLILVQRNSRYYREIANVLPEVQWGTLFGEMPVTQKDLNQFEEQEQEHESQLFSLFEEDDRKVETRNIRIARSIVFRRTIKKIYDCTCVICNTGLVSTSNTYEIEASHIVPKSQHGSDDSRNGLALCKRHHWAFDNGLLSIKDNYKVIVPERILALPRNGVLEEFNNKKISEPCDLNLRPDLSALRWHRENVLAS